MGKVHMSSLKILAQRRNDRKDFPENVNGSNELAGCDLSQQASRYCMIVFKLS